MYLTQVEADDINRSPITMLDTSCHTEPPVGANLLSLGTESCPLLLISLTRAMFYYLRYQGYISAALVLGGVDSTGPHLYSIYPHGSTDKLPYVTMGSGSLAAMAVFESRYEPNMEVSLAQMTN